MADARGRVTPAPAPDREHPPAVLGVLGGGLVDSTAPLLRADDLGVLRGDAVFETIRVDGDRRYNEQAHLDRLARSAAMLGLPSPDGAGWQALTDLVLGAWTGGEAILRLVYTRGVEDSGVPTGFAYLCAVPDSTRRARRAGVRVVTLTRGLAAGDHADAPWLLVGAKTTSYAVNMAAQRYARSHDADDAIFVSVDGQVLEAPTATVVWALDETLCTPPVDVGILDGTAAHGLFERAAAEGFGAAVRRASVADLHAADAVWLVSSVRGAVTVTAIDGKPRGDAGLTTRVHRAAGVSA